jgi:GH15 family glucan-1,4-alpha-glucosidase
MDSLPIGDYALLSDCHSAALISRAGSVDWLCFPRFDAPAVFGRLLDADGGHFAIRPAGDFQVSRAYLDQTMALETTFRAPGGIAVLTDAMAMGRNDRGHQLGAGSPGVLMRRLQCTQGELDVDVTYAPRPEYGLIYPIRRWSREASPPVAARAGSCFPRRPVFSSTGPLPPRASTCSPGRPLASHSSTDSCGSRR